MWMGRPTVRRAEVLSGNRMTQEAKAGTPKGDGKTGTVGRSLLRWCRITARIRTPVVRLERALTCVG
jgi:hypothetical protein